MSYHYRRQLNKLTNILSILPCVDNLERKDQSSMQLLKISAKKMNY